jgi:hypothetical protein
LCVKNHNEYDLIKNMIKNSYGCLSTVVVISTKVNL